MAILGLASTESYANDRFKNQRRMVFHNYPNGKAPLCGLLSLITGGGVERTEDSDDPEFSWWEDRWQEYSTITAATAGPLGPFMRLDGSTTAGDPVDDGSANGWKADTVYSVKVAATTFFRVGHIVQATVNVNSAASTFDLRAVVTEVTSSTVLKIRALNNKAQASGIDNGNGKNVGIVLLVIGHAAAQGASISGNAIHTVPVNFGNYCGIQRTHFDITGTALKTSLKYDQTGPYKERAKKASLEHMIGIERSFLWGVKNKYYDGTNPPTYTSDGIISFLARYEAADSEYRGGTGAAALTLDTEDGKRDIRNSTGVVSEAWFDGIVERAFRVTHNPTNEKLALCGNGALKVINQLFRSKGVLQHKQASDQTYGMDIVSHLTPFGTLHYKTHPLFTANTAFRNAILILDVADLKYRYIKGRDTQLLKNRQANDADLRRDEWLTECGLELHYPEAHMFIRNVSSYTP